MTVQEVCFLVVGLGSLATESNVFLCEPVRLFTGKRYWRGTKYLFGLVLKSFCIFDLKI